MAGPLDSPQAMSDPGSTPDRQDLLAAELAERYLLEPLLAMPSWISPAELRSDPTWAQLRAHPRFAGLTGPA